jgi:Skp family chaperone for outer membrane proteins
MKKNFIALAAVFTLLSLNANAANTAVLDVEKIVKESVAMVDIQKKVTKKQEEYQKEVNAKQKELEAEQKKLEGKKTVLASDAFEKEMKKFEGKVDQLKELVDKKQNSLKKASVDAMGKVNDDIKTIIAELSKEKSLDLIVPAGQTLFYKDEMDVSAEILKRLNKKVTKVNVNFE